MLRSHCPLTGGLRATPTPQAGGELKPGKGPVFPLTTQVPGTPQTCPGPWGLGTSPQTADTKEGRAVPTETAGAPFSRSCPHTPGWVPGTRCHHTHALHTGSLSGTCLMPSVRVRRSQPVENVYESLFEPNRGYVRKQDLNPLRKMLPRTAGHSLFPAPGREEGREEYFRRVHRITCSPEGFSAEKRRLKEAQKPRAGLA